MEILIVACLLSQIVIFIFSDSYRETLEIPITDCTVLQLITISLGLPMFVIVKSVYWLNRLIRTDIISKPLNYQPFKKRE